LGIAKSDLGIIPREFPIFTKIRRKEKDVDV
jgi:hypothetical protein